MDRGVHAGSRSHPARDPHPSMAAPPAARSFTFAAVFDGGVGGGSGRGGAARLDDGGAALADLRDVLVAVPGFVIDGLRRGLAGDRAEADARVTRGGGVG